MSTTSNPKDGLMAINRRTQLRADIQHEVSYEFYSYDGQRLGAGSGTTINVSVGGMMLDTDKLLEASMKLLLEIVNPFYLFIATGHVVYAVQIDERQYRVGVHLEEVIQGGWELITEANSG